MNGHWGLLYCISPPPLKVHPLFPVSTTFVPKSHENLHKIVRGYEVWATITNTHWAKETGSLSKHSSYSSFTDFAFPQSLSPPSIGGVPSRSLSSVFLRLSYSKKPTQIPFQKTLPTDTRTLNLFWFPFLLIDWGRKASLSVVCFVANISSFEWTTKVWCVLFYEYSRSFLTGSRPNVRLPTRTCTPIVVHGVWRILGKV